MWIQMKKRLNFILVFPLLFSTLFSQAEVSANVNVIKHGQGVHEKTQNSNNYDIIFCTYDEFEYLARKGRVNEIYAPFRIYNDLPIAFESHGKKINSNLSVYQTVKRKTAEPEKKRFALLRINGRLTALISFSISDSCNVMVDVCDINADFEEVKGVVYGFFDVWVGKKVFYNSQNKSVRLPICVIVSEEFDLLRRYENEFLDNKENVNSCSFIEGSEMSFESLLYEVDKKGFFKHVEPSLEHLGSTNDSYNKKSRNVYTKKIVKKSNKANDGIYHKKIAKDQFSKKLKANI